MDKITDYISLENPRPKPKRHNLHKLADMGSYNCSFMTVANIRWFNFVIMNWLPDAHKPLVFLPCGRANKTRTEADPRKFISRSTTHQFLSKITRNNDLDRIILSEPLTVIPYSIESHQLRKDYDLPCELLSIQSEFIFIRQLALVLSKIKANQSDRKVIFYIGGAHHYFILYYANKMIGSPFQILFEIPPLGIRDYSKSALKFHGVIYDYLADGIVPAQEIPSLKKYLKKRGRYTNQAFWKSILVLQKDNQTEITICQKSDRITGFSALYSQISQESKAS
jgi:hypothetical protein